MTPRAGRDDAEVGGDARRRAGVVAGDHDHAHAGGARLGDRRPRLRARRIDDPDESRGRPAPARSTRPAGGRSSGRQRPIRDGERAQREVGEPVDRREDLAPAGVGQRAHLAGDPLSVQRASRTSGAPFVTTASPNSPASVGLDGAHQLALGRERHLADALEARRPALRAARDLRLGDEERGLGRIALDRPLAAVLAQHGVVRQAAAASTARTSSSSDADRRAGVRRRAARPRAGSRCR